MKKPILPEHVKMKMAAVKWTPSRLDPASKKLYNKWNREHKKWEKAEEKRAVEQAAKAERDKIARIERHWYEDITSQIEENDNTINWNVERKCKSKYCLGILKPELYHYPCYSMRLVLTPKLNNQGKRGKFVCNCCDRMDKWINESELQEALWDL